MFLVRNLSPRGMSYAMDPAHGFKLLCQLNLEFVTAVRLSSVQVLFVNLDLPKQLSNQLSQHAYSNLHELLCRTFSCEMCKLLPFKQVEEENSPSRLHNAYLTGGYQIPRFCAPPFESSD